MKTKFDIERMRAVAEGRAPAPERGPSFLDFVPGEEARRRIPKLEDDPEADAEADALNAAYLAQEPEEAPETSLARGYEAGQRSAAPEIFPSEVEPERLPGEAGYRVRDLAAAEGGSPIVHGLARRPTFAFQTAQPIPELGPQHIVRRQHRLDPAAMATGAFEGATMGNAAELTSRPAAWFDPQGRSQEQIEREMDEAIAYLQRVSPENETTGEVIGALGSMALPAASSLRAVQGLGWGARAAIGAAEAGAMGAAATGGRPGEQSWGEIAEGAARAAPFGAAVPVIGRGLQGAGRQADRIRLRAAGATRGDIERLERNPLFGSSASQRLRRAADVIREEGLSGLDRLEDEAREAILAASHERAIAGIEEALDVPARVSPRRFVQGAREGVTDPLARSEEPALRRAAAPIEETIGEVAERYIAGPRREAEAAHAQREAARLAGIEARGLTEGVTVPSSELSARIRQAGITMRPTMQGPEAVVAPGVERAARDITREFEAPVVGATRRGSAGRLERVPEAEAETLARELSLDDLRQIRLTLSRRRGAGTALEVIDAAIADIYARGGRRYAPPVPPMQLREPSLSLRDLARMKREQDRVIGRGFNAAEPPPNVEARRDYRGFINRTSEEALDEASRSMGDPGALERFRRAKQRFAITSEAGTWASHRARQEAVNRQISLTDYVAGAGAASGGPMSAIGAAAANRFLRRYETGAMASILERFRAASERSSPRAAAAMQQVATRGPAAAIATDFELQQTDPAYRSESAAIEDEESSLVDDFASMTDEEMTDEDIAALNAAYMDYQEPGADAGYDEMGATQ